VDVDVCKLGLERYAQLFSDNEIDSAILGRLTANDLKCMGITIVGHRRKLLDAIETLHGSNVVSSTDFATTDVASLRTWLAELVGPERQRPLAAS